MRVPNAFKKIKGFLSPPKGQPERARFSLGKRPIPGKLPSQDAKQSTEQQGRPLGNDIDKNAAELKKIFHVPESSDVVFREITCADPNLRVVVAYVEGMSSFDKLFRCVLQPLMLLSPIRKAVRKDPVAYLESALLANGQVKRKETFEQVVESMVMGDTLVLIEKSSTALIVETKGWEHRPVGEAVSERIVRGPQQGFVEMLRANTGLIRSILPTPDLVVESLDIGVTATTKCALLYMSSIANPKLVDECRRRILSLDVSEILNSGELEQLIESSHTLLPTILSTERPDRVAMHLMQGMLAILVAGDPFALILPVNLFTFLTSPEDNIVRWPYGNVLRIIRYLAFFIAVFFPGLYIAIVNYHPEMVPTTLMMAIAATREPIPFPLWVEVLVMFFGFELIREAGIRIPSPIGPTIGIVGALLIGDAAVSASIVSPILVIVIAVTAVASFTLPNLEIGMFIRVAALVFIVAGATLGLLGIVALMYVLMNQAFSTSSLGVPFLSPVAPLRPPALRGALVSPPWAMEMRPEFLRPRNLRRLGPTTRLWDEGETLKTVHPRGKGGKRSEQGKKGHKPGSGAGGQQPGQRERQSSGRGAKDQPEENRQDG